MKCQCGSPFVNVFFFTELFDGDHEKVKALNEMVCRKMGFEKWLSVSGQTYTRKVREHMSVYNMYGTCFVI